MKAKIKISNQSSKKNDSFFFAIANDMIRKFENELQFDREVLFDASKIDSFYLFFDVNFQLIDDLLYHVKKNYFKFCISKNNIQNVLKLIHDDNSHADYHKIYVKLKFVYIRKLSRQLNIYIKHCSICQLNQIKRHRFYKKLKSIFTFFYHMTSQQQISYSFYSRKNINMMSCLQQQIKSFENIF